MSAPKQVAPAARIHDPLRFCIFTTIGLLAWALSPPVVVLIMSGMGLWAYTRAYRAGLRQSKCILRDARLVIGYLGVAFVAAGAVTLWELARLF